MKKIIFYCAIMFVLVLVLSCNFATELISGGGGPKNLAAELSAPDVVMLKWDAVEGATGYILELSIDGGESVSIIALPPELTSYEDLSAPEKSKLTYQVQVITESGPAGKSKVEIETGERKPNPLTVKPTYDEENSVAVTVGAQGGSVSLIDSNGVEYALAIPEGALSVDTEIRMTAAAIQDWPLDGNAIGAVRFEPQGLVLNDVAILTIGIPIDIDPGLALVGFAFEADGQEFHLQPSDPEKGQANTWPSAGTHLASPVFQQPKHIVRLPVMELKVGGVGQTTDESVSDIVKNNAPSDAGAELEQKRAAEAIVDDELAPVKKSTDPVREEAYEIGKAIFLAKDCKALNSQIVSFQKWRFSQSYLGLNDDQRREYTKQIWDELVDKVKEVLENAATDCEKSSEAGGSAAADSPCARALLEKIANPPAGTVSYFNLDLKNKLENKLSDQELQDIKDKLEKCKPKAYHISGAFGELGGVEGNACDVTKPFTMSGGVCMFFTPADENSGSFTYSCGPLGAQGGGTYTIGNGSMQISGSGSLGPDANSGSLTFAATQIDPAGCIP